MANNDIHFIRKELDRLQTKMANFDVTTEYAQSTSDTTAPTSGWSTTKPAPSEGYFVWARNIMNMGYGDIISEPYCIGDGLEHILSIDVEYIAWSDAYQSPPQSSEYWQTTAPSIQAGQYIWTRTKMVTTYGTNYTDPLRVTGIDGQDGADGQDGVSIKGDDGKGFDFIYYTTGSANFNTTPEDNVVRTQNQYNRWCDSPTPVDATHQYIYMSLRTTDNNGDWGHWSSPVLMSSIGEKGEDGEGFEIIFTRTNSDSTVPTFSNGQGSSSYTGTDSQGRHYQDADFTPNGWTDNQQGVDSNNKYEWASFRFKTVTNGEASWGNFNTPKIWATFSEDGESSYIHIRYSSVNNPSDVSQTTTSPTSTTVYIGICVSNSSGEPSFNCYSWKKWIPEEGIDYDGKFLHMKYASDVTFNQDGSVNTVTFTGNNGEDAGEWLGTLFDYTVTDSTTGADYTWTKIEGNGISNIQEQYAMSTSYTTAPTTGWRNTPLENEVGKFYWTRNVISFTDGTTTTTNAICVSGADGDGVHNAYYCTDSLSTPNTPSFSDIHANSSTASQNYDKWVEDPVAIDSTHRYIYISTSTSYSYVSGVKTWNSFSEPVLWSRYALDGSDGADGTNGTNGTNGIGYEYAYYTSDSSTAPTKPSGNVTATSGTKKWTTVPIPMTSTYKYMYISYRTVQGSTKSTWSNSALWSQFGEKGDTGASGKDGLGMEHIFYLTNTEITDWDSVTGDTNPVNWTTQPNTDDYVKSNTGWSDDATGVDSTHKYEYCSIRRKEYDTDGKTAKWGAFSTPALWSKFGEDGKSITNVVNYYASNNSSTAPSKSASNTWYTDVGNSNILFDSTHRYLWNYEKTYSGSTVVSETDPVAIAYWTEDGVAGKGISSVVEHYAVSTSNSTAPSSWQSTNDANFTMPVTTSTNKYLWNYETINFTTGNPYNSEKRVIGTHGEDGVSIGSVVNYYLASASSSGVTTSTSGWTPTVQATSSSKPYLWNYEIVKDVNGNTLSTTSPVIIANSSKSIKSITEYYCTSNSATAPADSSFSTTFVTTSPSSIYLWNYELITFYDNTTSATSKRIISTHGANGVDGKGEQFIFILTTEETIPSVPTSENQIVPATSQFITITGSVGSGSWTKGGVAYTKRVTKTTLGSSITPVVGDYVSKDTTIYYIGYVESTYVYLIELSSIWFDDPQDVDVTHPYQYITSRKFDTSTETWSEWSEPSLWNKYTLDGSQGKKGEDGSDGRDGTDITGEEIMQKLAGQKINATTIGGFEITDLMTTVLTNDTGAVYDAQNYGTYRIMKMGRLCLLVLKIYRFTFTSVGGHKIMFSIPTWAYPLSLMYMNSAPNLETISLGDEGCRVQSDGKSVGETVELSGVFVYFAKENVSLTGTSITINESSVMSSYPLTVTLKDANNNLLSDKSVEITVNGGTYTRKTTNGVASLNLNLGNGGTYGVDAKFNGDTAYANSITSKSVSVTPCTNPSIIFDAQNKKAQIVNTISSVKTPICGLSCIVKFNNDSTNMTTDSDGYLNFTTVLSQYSGTVKVTVTTNDANRCNSKSGSQSMSGGKTSETLTVASTPSEINSATDGRVWTGITPENLSSPWDGKYAKAYNIASGSNYATLDMLNSFNIPHTATVNKIKITFVYASLLGQTSLSKGNFPAPTISLTHTNNTQIINTVSIGQAISRTECGNWYVAEQEWNLSASDGLNTNGKWNKIGIRLNSAQNGGGGYGNNASYGVDYLIVEVTYTT